MLYNILGCSDQKAVPSKDLRLGNVWLDIHEKTIAKDIETSISFIPFVFQNQDHFMSRKRMCE